MKTRIFALMISLVLVFSSFSFTVAAVEEETEEQKNWHGIWSYFVADDSVTISGCKEDTNGVATIPSKIGNYPVTTVGAGYCIVPYSAIITELTVPDSVNSIGIQAFMSCKGLQKITLPDKIMDIGYNAFKDTGAYYDETNWDNGVFYLGKHLISGDEDKLEGTYAIKDGIYDIAAHAFSFNPKFSGTGRIYDQCENLTGITFPSSLKVIGDGAFLKCTGLLDITIPDTVEKIGKDAFKDTAYFRNGENWDGDALYINKHLVQADESIYGHCTIKEGTLTIAEGTFAGCENLTSATIPDGIRIIDDFTFSKCEKLTTINIPDSVAYIGSNAFDECTNLEYVYFGGSQREWNNIIIRDRNSALKDATVVFGEKSKTTSGVNGFSYEIDGNEAIIMGCDRKAEGKIKIPETIEEKPVTEISAEAFKDCKSITEVTLPASIKTIGASAFENSGITQIAIPSKVTEIKEKTFFSCSNLESVQIPESVKTIGASAFDKCPNITEIYFTGAEGAWKKIKSDDTNKILTTVTVNYESNFPITKSASFLQAVLGMAVAIILTAAVVVVVLVIKKKKSGIPISKKTSDK